MNQEVIIRPFELVPIPGRIESTLERVRRVAKQFHNDTCHTPKKLFISVELMEMLLAEVLPGAKEISVQAPGKQKNQIEDMDIYHVVEPGVIECGL